MARSFPKDFIFGASTAAYQIEGAAREDGRGEGIWDRFSHTPGKVHCGDTGDVACDHYHRYGEDLQLARAAHLGAYRFSINWARVLPEGVGRVNAAGLSFYDRIVDGCLARGIAPWPCFYHWDYSQALEDRGGWAARDSVDWYLELVSVVTERLKDRVGHWVLFNEPSIFTSLGYLIGLHAPGRKDASAYGAAVHHVSLATAEGARLLRSLAPNTKVGTVLALNHAVPASDSEADLRATAYVDAVMARSFLDPIFKGRYPRELESMILPHVRDGDLARLQGKLDFLGVNHYTRMRIGADAAEGAKDGAAAGGGLGFRRPPPRTPLTTMGWEIWPEGLYKAIERVAAEYGPIPIYITENGGAFNDAVAADGKVDDPARIALLSGYLGELARAIADGYDVRGYFIWSLLDNFEWAHGYDKRFGIVFVDYQTQKRIPKSSYHWYADLAHSKLLPE